MRQDGKPTIAGGLAESEFRIPRDIEVEHHGIPALAEVLGDETEAARLSWVKRLVRRKADDTWLLTIADPPFLSYGDPLRTQPWLVPHATTGTQFAYELDEAVRILASPDNPELEIERRHKLIEQHTAREEAHNIEARNAEQARQAAVAKAQSDAKTYRQSDWDALTTLERMFYTLATKLKTSNPALAAAIRATAEDSKRTGPTTNGKRNYPLPLPHCEWWAS
jgi:hypothetical protein